MNLTQYFSLVDTMARMSLKADASRYFFGYIWWLLEPLLFVLVFYVVFELILQNRKEDFLVFLMVGKLTFIWRGCTSSWVSSCCYLRCCCSTAMASPRPGSG